MNRRELFKGAIAALVAASVPLPVEALLSLPDSEVIAYLKRARADCIARIANPPMLMQRNGRVKQLPTEVQQEALKHINQLLKELNA